MSRKWILVFALVLALTWTLAACGGQKAATEAPKAEEPAATEEAKEEAPAAKEKTVVVGFTASQTGKYNVPSTRQTTGLQMWMDEVNKAGGVKLSDGTVLKFKAVSYDDESNKDRVQELYTKLATDDKADFLISPYSSGLTAAAAVIAEQYGIPMITTGAASDATYKQGYTVVYQAYTPASRYLTGAIDLLMDLDPNAKKVAFVYENSKFATDVNEAAKAYAEKNGFDVVLFEGYDPDIKDFNAIINKIEAAAPDAILGGGHFQDGSTFARQLYEKGAKVKFISLLVAPPEPTFAELGDAAVGVIGPSQWEPAAKYTPESAKAAGIEWYGPTGEEFTKAYQAAHDGEEPSYHVAGGYAAGLILQKAIETADSVEKDAVLKAMDAIDMMTFFGHIKFDTSEEAHGLQIGHDMILIQWQKDGGKLVKQVVWPKAGATADPIYPIR
ncbi:MAG TPA: branched-chain amino acid ABC transporter substrate-binding protein [Anaerolineae bacterium]|nr:ABC transporter substrate-binding protein [Caldilineae bacterium]HID33477.1 branched-chain amino acid ABC transporter substrate-binding protein [Anaerolineae bacterium]HIQ12681.1 branched-chain amino acid ABC transporter substrate-binding protein [Caldilineales bacterium]